MKRIPQKAILAKPEPIIIKIDPKQLKTGIVLPKVKYQVLASVENELVFNGMVLPIPKVLIYYLTHNELMIVSTILEETNEYGECASSVKELATKIKISTPTVSSCLYSLRKVGLLQEAPNGQRGAGRIRKLNYTAIQHLNDLVEGEDSGIYTRIRKATRKTNIMNLTKDDIKNAYDNHVLEPGHDLAEEEEYD
jgi:DNA-binding MarR family transcriptional regulator|nr:MAG TPA: Transcriptional regulator, MarR/EmrR family, emrR, transcriptional regulator, DNA-binding [Bacteriophage sp.]